MLHLELVARENLHGYRGGSEEEFRHDPAGNDHAPVHGTVFHLFMYKKLRSEHTAILDHVHERLLHQEAWDAVALVVLAVGRE